MSVRFKWCEVSCQCNAMVEIRGKRVRVVLTQEAVQEYFKEEYSEGKCPYVNDPRLRDIINKKFDGTPDILIREDDLRRG